MQQICSVHWSVSSKSACCHGRERPWSWRCWTIFSLYNRKRTGKFQFPICFISILKMKMWKSKILFPTTYTLDRPQMDFLIVVQHVKLASKNPLHNTYLSRMQISYISACIFFSEQNCLLFICLQSRQLILYGGYNLKSLKLLLLKSGDNKRLPPCGSWEKEK